MKTSELTGAALDWAVAKCEGKDADCEVHAGNVLYGRVTSGFIHYTPSTNWAQGGPIIERKKIPNTGDLASAMRCYVASKFGDEVEIPQELING